MVSPTVLLGAGALQVPGLVVPKLISPEAGVIRRNVSKEPWRFWLLQ